MYTTRVLDPTTGDIFAELVERNNGVYGGCWCTAFHPRRPADLTNQESKHQRVLNDSAHAALVMNEVGRAQGWAQHGDGEELAAINRVQYAKGASTLPDWRIACIFVDKAHSGQGVARAAVVGAISEISLAGGGRIEAIAEVTHSRTAQPRFLFSATAELFESLDFTRGRQVGKHPWVSRTVASTRR